MKKSITHLVPLLSIFTVFLSGQLAAQSDYIRTFDDIAVMNGVYVEPLADGGVIVVANADGGSSSSRGLQLVRFDACDELVWSREVTYDKAGLQAQDLFETGTGDLIIAGYYNQEGYYDAFLMKLSGNGNLQFSNVYRIGAGVNEFIYSAGMLSNGNYFIFGNVGGTGAEPYQNFMAILEEDGSTVSANTYYEIPVWGRSIATADGGVLARSGNLIYKLNEEGGYEWGKSLPLSGYYQSKPVEVDGGFVYALYPDDGDKSLPASLIKIDHKGELVWISDGFESFDIREIVALEDGSFLAPGNIMTDLSGKTGVTGIYNIIDRNGALRAQFIRQPGADERVMLMSAGKGRDGAIYLAGTTTVAQRLQLSRINSSNELNTCNTVSHSAGRSVEPFNLQPEKITPHGISITRIPLELKVDDVFSEFTQSCYHAADLTIEIGEDKTLCPGTAMELTPDREYPYYQWSTGETTRSIMVTEAGTYRLEAGNGCKSVADEITISYYPEPDTEFSVEPREVTPLEPVVFKGSSNNGYQITWTFGGEVSHEPSFDFVFDRNGKIPVVYAFIDENGCGFADSLDVYVNYQTFWIPKAFTPDGDGLNDEFKPVGHGIVHYRMEIYTRWGEKIYSEQNGGWDGKFQGAYMPVEGYVYEITLTNQEGEETFKRGVFTLLR